MILQALYNYYQRKIVDPDSDIAPPGFEFKEIPFVIVIDGEGRLLNIEDTREGEGRLLRAKRYLVPQSVKRSVNIEANLLWDSAEYAFGIPIKTTKSERVEAMHKSFVDRIDKDLGDIGDEGLSGLKKFLARHDETELKEFPAWKDIEQSNPFISFRYGEDVGLICQRERIYRALMSAKTTDSEGNLCLITGEIAPIEITHPAIKGVYGAQSSGANIVSMNLDAFTSFRKEQGMNAPIGKSAAFAYTTALNHLLRRDSRQKLHIGDATIVFWAEKPHDLECQIPDIFGEPPKDDPDRQNNAVRSLFQSFEKGAYADIEGRTRFYVLGLSPNAARIAIRFWNVATVAELSLRIKRHFDDLEIARRTVGKNPEPEYLSLFRILVAVAIQGKSENINPILSGELVRSILESSPYPRTLLSAAIRRIRSSHEVTYPLAAAIKACLNRRVRLGQLKEREATIMLDEENQNIGYRLGRLFAVLEKAQEEASPGIDATIRDRYYGAASSTPVTVFPILMKMKNHHLSKIVNRGRAVNMEKLIGAILAVVSEFPAHLNIDDQGRFAIGYYHQRQEFFKKIKKED